MRDERKNTKVSQAIVEFIAAKRAARKSENTINEYSVTFKRFKAFVPEDPLLPSIEPLHIATFLGGLTGLSNKTVLNAHTALSSLWTWAVMQGICEVNIVRLVEPPKPEKRVIQPFTVKEVIAMARAAARLDTPKCKIDRPTALRDLAMLFLLVDTGIRASELCAARIQDISDEGLLVYGKGAKERVVPMCDITRESIAAYLQQVRLEAKPSDPLFTCWCRDEPLTRSGLLQFVERLGERAGVRNAHPHRFRHFFAIAFVRSGGDGYTLQDILGHETMDMVKIYLQMGLADVTAVHSKASPVRNLGLGDLGAPSAPSGGPSPEGNK